MICTHCGTTAADTDKFCPECGAPIIRPIPEEAAPVGGVDPGVPHETTPQSAIADSSPDKGSSTAQSAESAIPDAPHDDPDAPPAAKKKSHKALWIVLTCVALAAVAAVALIVRRPWSRNNAKENPLPEVTNKPAAAEEPVEEFNPEETIRAAFGKLNEADSMHMDFVEDIFMVIGVPSLGYTQNVTMSFALGCDSDKANGTSRIEGSMSTMGYEESVLVYAETVDGRVLTYTSTDGGKTWTQGDDSDGADSALSDPTASIDVWMKHAKDFEKTGTEQVNGCDTTVYTGKLSGEYVKDAAGMAGGMFGTIDEAMLNDLDDLPITFWIDNGSGRIVRIVLDMKDMMETLLTKALKESLGEQAESIELSVVADRAAVTCDLSKFNEIPPIGIPDEARGNGTTSEPEADGIVGTWTLYGGEDEETQQYVDLMLGMGMDMVFVFNEDGTGSVATVFQGEEDKNDFTYTLENGEIVIDGSGAPYRIEDGLLHLTADSAKLIFKRK